MNLHETNGTMPMDTKEEITLPKQEPGQREQDILASATVTRPNYRTHYTLSGHTMAISAVKFSPNGKVLASAGEMINSYSSFQHDSYLTTLAYSCRQAHKALERVHRPIREDAVWPH